MIIYIPDVHALGLEAAQGTLAVESYYWDLDDPMRAFGKRFMAKQGTMPNQTQAAIYGAVQHYLKCVAAAGTADADTVMKAIRGTPVDDFMTHGAKIRDDGRLMRDTYLFQVKKPSESKEEWDYYKLVHRIPGEQTVIPANESKCRLLHA
jgi:branched-chain amino acid transport system substrate-binding protein